MKGAVLIPKAHNVLQLDRVNKYLNSKPWHIDIFIVPDSLKPQIGPGSSDHCRSWLTCIELDHSPVSIIGTKFVLKKRSAKGRDLIAEKPCAW